MDGTAGRFVVCDFPWRLAAKDHVISLHHRAHRRKPAAPFAPRCVRAASLGLLVTRPNRETSAILCDRADPAPRIARELVNIRVLEPSRNPLDVSSRSWLMVTIRSPFPIPRRPCMNRRENKKPKLNAEAAYENAHLVTRDLLQRIGELLADMPAPGDERQPIHWGHVGDVNEVNRRLSQIIAFLSNADE
jgi:hypothetical protein